MRLKLICCEIFFREVCSLIASSRHTWDVEFLPKGLHDLGNEKMVARLQKCIDAVTTDHCDAIVLGYGLCNNGIVGLSAGKLKLVVPRSHDCIGIFMGDRHRYRESFDAHPGTYYRTTGWIERDDATSAQDITVQQQLGLFMQYETLVEKYGEENAKYIMEQMGDGRANYDRLVYINMGLGCEGDFIETARREADANDWTFEEMQGSMSILKRLIDGDWDDDFLVVEPGGRIAVSYDDDIVNGEKGDAS